MTAFPGATTRCVRPRTEPPVKPRAPQEDSGAALWTYPGAAIHGRPHTRVRIAWRPHAAPARCAALDSSDLRFWAAPVGWDSRRAPGGPQGRRRESHFAVSSWAPPAKHVVHRPAKLRDLIGHAEAQQETGTGTSDS